MRHVDRIKSGAYYYVGDRDTATVHTEFLRNFKRHLTAWISFSLRFQRNTLNFSNFGGHRNIYLSAKIFQSFSNTHGSKKNSKYF
jgi:hypothetical protein